MMRSSCKIRIYRFCFMFLIWVWDLLRNAVSKNNELYPILDIGGISSPQKGFGKQVTCPISGIPILQPARYNIISIVTPPKKIESQFTVVRFYFSICRGCASNVPPMVWRDSDPSEASVHVGAVDQPWEVATGAEYGSMVARYGTLLPLVVS